MSFLSPFLTLILVTLPIRSSSANKTGPGMIKTKTVRHSMAVFSIERQINIRPDNKNNIEPATNTNSYIVFLFVKRIISEGNGKKNKGSFDVDITKLTPLIYFSSKRAFDLNFGTLDIDSKEPENSFIKSMNEKTEDKEKWFRNMVVRKNGVEFVLNPTLTRDSSGNHLRFYLWLKQKTADVLTLTFCPGKSKKIYEDNMLLMDFQNRENEKTSGKKKSIMKAVDVSLFDVGDVLKKPSCSHRLIKKIAHENGLKFQYILNFVKKFITTKRDKSEEKQYERSKLKIGKETTRAMELNKYVGVVDEKKGKDWDIEIDPYESTQATNDGRTKKNSHLWVFILVTVSLLVLIFLSIYIVHNKKEKRTRISGASGHVELNDISNIKGI